MIRRPPRSTPTDTLFPTLLSSDLKSYSGFAQVNTNLTEHIKLTAGVRYTKEKKDARIFRDTLRPGLVSQIFGPFAELTPSRKEGSFDWSLTGQYYFDSRNVLYASVARGSKSGGFQTLASNRSEQRRVGKECVGTC